MREVLLICHLSVALIGKICHFAELIKVFRDFGFAKRMNKNWEV